jgi:hypothetical protein
LNNKICHKGEYKRYQLAMLLQIFQQQFQN